MNTNKNNVNHPISITPSGFFGSDSKMIGEINNALTEQENKTLLSFIINNNNWDVTETHYNEDGTIIYDSGYWENRVATIPTLLREDKEIVEILNRVILRLKPQIEEFFGVKAEPTNPALVRWFPGQFQHPHADKELHIGDDAGKPNDFPWYDLATIIYLNDDYEGGELYFPVQDIKFKPKMGAAYFFPGDRNYIHGITEITSGIRYTCPFFWTILSHNNESDA